MKDIILKIQSLNLSLLLKLISKTLRTAQLLQGFGLKCRIRLKELTYRGKRYEDPHVKAYNQNSDGYSQERKIASMKFQCIQVCSFFSGAPGTGFHSLSQLKASANSANY